MSIAPAPTTPAAPATSAPQPLPRPWNPLAAFLSYLVPGLGQIYQGRLGKGLLFFGCIYALFFYGTLLGSGTAQASTPDSANGDKVTEYRITSPVYLPDTADKNNPLGLPRLLANLYNRPQFAAQFWAGIAAWPAVLQYLHDDGRGEGSFLGNYQREPSEMALNAVQTNGSKIMELGWVFTVIAGVLNILVIYDALAGPACLPAPPAKVDAPPG